MTFILFHVGLYRKGLVYMDVPIADEDCIVGERTVSCIKVFVILKVEM